VSEAKKGMNSSGPLWKGVVSLFAKQKTNKQTKTPTNNRKCSQDISGIRKNIPDEKTRKIL